MSNKNVTWSSDNESVALVDQDGLVTPVAVGTATVTAISEEDPSVFATCEVNVVAAEIPVTGVALNQTVLNLIAGGKTAVLTASITPENATNKNISWTSSNHSVATVSDAVITPLGIGTTTITVTTEDGSFTAECVVHVSAPDPDDEKGELPRTGGGQQALLGLLSLSSAALLLKRMRRM